MSHDPTAFRRTDAVVAIPVRDEAERIADCLIALSEQQGRAPGLLLLVNNGTDRTADVVADLVPSLRSPVVVIERTFPYDQAHAGQARRAALEAADRLAPPGIPLLTTDGDGRVEPGWLAANLGYLDRGLDAVFGCAVIDPIEALQIPPALHQADAEECAFAAMLDQIESLLDPDPDDPWPRHTEHSGASIAVSRQAYRAVGGLQALPLGEDRAFHDALRRRDARIRHAPEVRVVVSGRILGRAVGGMADTIRRRLVAPDTMLDTALEPVAARVRRVRWRRAARLAFVAGDGAAWAEIAAGAGFDAVAAEAALRHTHFGAAWACLDTALVRVPVPVAALPNEMARATALRERLLRRATCDIETAAVERAGDD